MMKNLNRIVVVYWALGVLLFSMAFTFSMNAQKNELSGFDYEVTVAKGLQRKVNKVQRLLDTQDYGAVLKFGSLGVIESLEPSYCSDAANDLLEPNESFKRPGATYLWDAFISIPSNTVPYIIEEGGLYYFSPQAVSAEHIGSTIGVIVYRIESGQITDTEIDYTLVKPLPTIYEFTSDGAVCDGEAYALQLSGSDFAEGNKTTYELFREGQALKVDSKEGTGSLLTFNVTEAGTYYVIATNNIVGCPAEMTNRPVVSVNPNPVLAVSPDTSICNGQTKTLTVSSDLDPDVTYAWDDGSGGAPEATGASFDVSPSSTTTYTVTGTSSIGCSESVNVTVTVNDRPTGVISGTATICEGESTNLTFILTGVGPWDITYTDGTSDFTINNVAVSPHIVPVSPATTTTYTLKSLSDDDNNCGAQASDLTGSAFVTVNTAPTANISGAETICAGDTAELTITLTGTTPWSLTYNDGTSDQGPVSISSSPYTLSVTPAADADYTLVSLTDNNSCQAQPAGLTGTGSVTVNALPVPSIVGDDDVCLNEAGVTYTTDAGMSNYAWSISGGTITAGSTTNQITVTWDVAGAGSVSVNYENLNGCTATSPSSLAVTVNDLPVPVITGSIEECIGATNVVYSTDADMSGYVWNVSAGGSIVAGGGTNSIQVNWNSSGAQTVDVSYFDTNGCQAATPTVYNVTVQDLPVPTISGDADACLNSSTSYFTETGMTNYVWAVSAGGTITSGQGTDSIYISWSTTGAKTVSVTYDDALGCSAAAPTNYAVLVNALPTPTITGFTDVCLNRTQTYSTEANMTNYSWAVIGGTIVLGDGTNSVNVQWDTQGVHSISVNYVNGNNCTAAVPTQENITVNALPVPTITGVNAVCINDSESYSTEAGQNNYVWSVIGGTITGGQGTNNVFVTWNTAGNQSVSVTYEEPVLGCAPTSPTELSVTVNQVTASLNITNPIPPGTTRSQWFR
jgi:hypothetical protein